MTEPDVYSQRFFCKIYLRKGYHQIPVNQAAVQKTAITTPFVLCELECLSRGTKTGPQGLLGSFFLDG
jgi:hypothetical protein